MNTKSLSVGIYQSSWGRVGGGQRYIAVVAEILSRTHAVEIVHHVPEFHPSPIEEAMGVDLSRVSFRYVPRPHREPPGELGPVARLRVERELGAGISAPYRTFIDSSDSIPFFCHAPRGVLLTHFPLVTFEEFHGHTSEQWERRGALKRFASHAFHRWEWKQRFATYERCIVNSVFTKQWMRRLWGFDADVVHPPTRDGFIPEPKESFVLSIGAFHASGHKKHEVLIECFRNLCRSGLHGWRLVLVGSLYASAADQAYLVKLRRLAEGFPIDVLTDIPGKSLNSLVCRSSVLWHAMGYGVDPRLEPRRCEHFGMVATEAMAAGCVPVVFNGGGLPEIVTHGRDGFLWTTTNELEAYTRHLIGDDNRRKELASAAVEASKRFNRESFERQLLAALSPVLN